VFPLVTQQGPWPGRGRGLPADR